MTPIFLTKRRKSTIYVGILLKAKTRNIYVGFAKYLFVLFSARYKIQSLKIRCIEFTRTSLIASKKKPNEQIKDNVGNVTKSLDMKRISRITFSENMNSENHSEYIHVKNVASEPWTKRIFNIM